MKVFIKVFAMFVHGLKHIRRIGLTMKRSKMQRWPNPLFLSPLYRSVLPTRPSEQCEFCDHIFVSSLISQDCQSGSIGQSSPGGPGIKVASSHDMHSENSFVCHLLLFVVLRWSLFVTCRCLSLFVVCSCLSFDVVCCLSFVIVCRFWFVVVCPLWFVVCLCLLLAVFVCRLSLFGVCCLSFVIVCHMLSFVVCWFFSFGFFVFSRCLSFFVCCLLFVVVVCCWFC